MFRRGYKITLNRVHDRITVREGTEELTLAVDGDAMRMVAGLEQAKKMLIGLAEAPDEERAKAAQYFAGVIFGEEQAARLVEFYRGDALCVINLCGRYFKDRLGDLITKAQKKGA